MLDKEGSEPINGNLEEKILQRDLDLQVLTVIVGMPLVLIFRPLDGLHPAGLSFWSGLPRTW